MAKSYFSCIIILLIWPSTVSCWWIFPEQCSPGSVRVYQWPSGFAGLHIPKYTVQIINEAWHAKGVSDVRIACLGFASTTLINPTIFRRIDPGICLLRNGRTINPGEVVSFEYSNILPFPFIILDLKCL